MRSLAIGAFLFSVACTGGTGGSSDAAGARGEVGGPCYPNDTCNEGLVCENDRCSANTEGEAGGPCFPNDTCNTDLVCVEGTCLSLVADAGVLDGGGSDAGAEDAGGLVDASTSDPDASSDCTTTQTNLLTNGSFDMGDAPWVESSDGGFEIIVNESEVGGVDAHSGSFFAMLGGYSPLGGATDTLHQDIAIPADAEQMTISGVIRVETAETLGLAFDTLDLELVDPTSSATLETLASVSNLDANTAFEPFSGQVLAAAPGSTVRLIWTADVDSSNNTAFLIDTLVFEATICI